MKLLVILFIILIPTSILAELNPKQNAVIFENEIDTITPSFKIKWQRDNSATKYTVKRKIFGSNFFNTLMDNLEWHSTQYVDNDVVKGVHYEYKIEKIGLHDDTVEYIGFGYSSMAWGLEAKFNQGKILVLVDNRFHKSLKNELDRLEEDLVSEGWQVVIKKAPRAETYNTKAVSAIKQIILKENEISPLKSVLLIGRIPVAYSGRFAIDGHRPDHEGAWPSDVYYADIDGNWIDSTANLSAADASRQHNIPFDGKFDPSQIPSLPDIEIGRVDFYNLPDFKVSELELLRRYLNKNHKWRKGEISVPKRAIIDDQFGLFGGEAAGSSAWFNYSSVLGAANIKEDRMRYDILENSYLMAYGGHSGSYNSVALTAYTDEYATKPQNVAFLQLFGSYNGDWDSENNILRAAIASEPICIASAWGSRPAWHLHPMSLGETFGTIAKMAQSNATLYETHRLSGKLGVHIALMGDPSLKLFNTKAIETISINQTNDNFDLTWDNPEEDIIGYYVFASNEKLNAYKLLTNKHISENQYTISKDYKYAMIRAVKYEQTASGYFYNLSSGKIIELK